MAEKLRALTDIIMDAPDIPQASLDGTYKLRVGALLRICRPAIETALDVGYTRTDILHCLMEAGKMRPVSKRYFFGALRVLLKCPAPTLVVPSSTTEDSGPDKAIKPDLNPAVSSPTPVRAGVMVTTGGLRVQKIIPEFRGIGIRPKKADS